MEFKEAIQEACIFRTVGYDPRNRWLTNNLRALAKIIVIKAEYIGQWRVYLAARSLTAVSTFTQGRGETG